MNRKLAVASLITAWLTFGCHLPGQVPAEHARVVVHYGSVNLSPNADLALVLDVGALLGGDYKVQAVNSSDVEKISAKVTGVNLVEPITTSVNLIDCANGIATLNFTNLPPGPVEVAVNALDFDGQPLAWGTGKAVIKPNQTAQVTLKCSSVGGNLVVSFECPDLCAGSPTPSPSPVPPSNPVQANLLHLATGLAADHAGNVFILGVDPGTTQADLLSKINLGRIIKVDGQTFTAYTTPLDDAMGVTEEGEIRGDTFSYMDSNFNRRLNLQTGSVSSKAAANWSSRPWNSNTITDGGEIIHGFGKYTAHGAEGYDRAGLLNENGWLYSNTVVYGTHNWHRPIALAYDKINHRILWSSDAGLAALPYGPDTCRGLCGPNADTLYLLDLRPTNEKMYGFTLVTDDASQVLFTKQGNSSVYHWNSVAKGTPTVAFESKYGHPYRIEKGQDGKYYLMIFEGAVGPTTFGSPRFRVIRFTYDVASNSLEAPVLMVDTMPDKPASF